MAKNISPIHNSPKVEATQIDKWDYGLVTQWNGMRISHFQLHATIWILMLNESEKQK